MALHLDDSLIIGKGAHRVCYRHPLASNKCIKINHTENDRTQELECKYYKKLGPTSINWKYISKYYGVIDTNLGDGYEYELILDYDQTISLPVSEYLSASSARDVPQEIVLNSLKELKRFLMDNNVIVRNLRPYNIMFKRISPQHGYSVIIDNIGHHNNYFHLSDYIAFLARKSIQKKWKKFELNL